MSISLITYYKICSGFCWIVKNDSGMGFFGHKKAYGGNFLIHSSKNFDFTKEEAIRAKNKKFKKTKEPKND